MIRNEDSKNRAYVPALDYLRAIAALTVVFYHALITFRGYVQPGWNLENWPHFWNPIAIYFVEGHTAVGLFMVLSGYVLTLGVLNSDISYWRFLRNRIVRIYPLYILLTIYGIYLHPEIFSFAALAQTILPFANITVGSINSEVITALFWAVAVEVQFYLIFPFIITFLKKDGYRYILLLLLLVITLRLLSLFFKVDEFAFVYTTIFGRLDQFLIGILAAYIGAKEVYKHRLFLPLSIFILLALLVLFHRLGGYPVHAWWRLGWHTVEAVAWAMVILASVNSPYRMPPGLRRVLTVVANMSYSIYLLHSTVFQVVGERKAFFLPFQSIYMNGFLHGLVCLPAILVLSYLTYWVVERPFMQLRVQYVSKASGAA